MTIRSKALSLSVPSVTVRTRARAEGLWLYGYGAFQGAVAAADSFMLFFAAGVLGASASSVGLVDAIESLGYTAGAVVIGLVMRRFSQYRALLILLVGAVSIPLFLFSFISTLTFAIALAAFFGFVWAPTSILTPMVATQNVPRARWSGVLAQLSQYGALGGAAGMVVSSLWLAVSQHLAQPEIGVRLLWVVLGGVALLAAFVVHSFLPSSPPSGPRRVSLAAASDWVSGQGQG
ncbi:MAG: MFS transporter, partial [Chloroflexi bacterium]|nr:MFS transporter [Chloroflexota bacterium]